MKGCLQILFEYSPYYIPVLFAILLQSLLLCKRQSRSKDVVTPITATTQQSFKEVPKEKAEPSSSSPGENLSNEKPKPSPRGLKDSREKLSEDTTTTTGFNEIIITAKTQVGSKEFYRRRPPRQPDDDVDTETTIYERRSKNRADRADSIRSKLSKSRLTEDALLALERTQMVGDREEATSPRKTETMVLGEWIEEQETQEKKKERRRNGSSPSNTTQCSSVRQLRNSSFDTLLAAPTPSDAALSPRKGIIVSPRKEISTSKRESRNRTSKESVFGSKSTDQSLRSK
uniref:EOG090X0BWU n=1 Tax=Haemonchus contortus TaxID=6289 RepID=A0A7I4XT29_HAECO